MIPKIIHQVWISRSDEPLPRQCAGWVAAMAAMHPGWEHKLWGNELLEIYADDAVIRAAWNRPKCKEAHIVDRLRLLLLRDFGGVYCDVDAEPVRPFDSLIEAAGDAEFVSGLYQWSENEGCRADVGTLLASENSGFLREMIEYLPDDLKQVGGGRRIAKVLLDRIDCRARLVNYRYWFAKDKTEETLILQIPHLLSSWARR